MPKDFSACSASSAFKRRILSQALGLRATLRAVVTSTAAGTERFASGYQEIEYPHIQRRQIIKPAETALKIVDVKIAPSLTVGYVNGVGDQVPPAIEQLGAKLMFIEQDELAWGDLSKHNAIVTGVRAYESAAPTCAPTIAGCSTTPRAAGRSSCSTTSTSSTSRSTVRIPRR